MPTLANIHGASLVPDTSKILNNFFSAVEFGEKRSDRERLREGEVARQQEVSGLADDLSDPNVTEQQEKEAFFRLLQLDPQVAKGIKGFIEAGDAAKLQELAGLNEKRLRQALELKELSGGREERVNALSRMAQEAIVNNEDPSEFVKGMDMTDDKFANFIHRHELMGLDVKTITKRLTDASAQPQFQPTRTVETQRGTVTQELDPSGNISEIGVKPPAGKETRTTLERNAEAAGLTPGTPDFQKFIGRAVNKPGTKIEINKGFKVPPGFRRDPNDEDKLIPIKGGPKENLKAENASKVQGLRSAKRAFEGDPGNGIPSARDLIFDEDGSLDQTNLVNASLGTPFTEGRLLRAKMEQGIQAITRSETGAAMPDTELDNTRIRFMPAPGDTVEIAKLKLDLFEDWMGGALKLIDPDGRFEAERFQSEMAKRAKKKNIKIPKNDFSDMSDDELLKGF